jgi:hypothetical protein
LTLADVCSDSLAAIAAQLPPDDHLAFTLTCRSLHAAAAAAVTPRDARSTEGRHLRSTTFSSLCGVSLAKLQWGVSCGAPLAVPLSCAAAKAGRLEELQWLRSVGCPWGAPTCAAAAAGGHMDMLLWARAHGCPWDEETVIGAAGHGHVPILKYALEGGCPTTWECAPDGQPAVTAAIEHGHMHVVHWLFANGARPEPTHYMHAGRFGRLDLMQWLHARGVPLNRPWFVSSCMAAVLKGHLVELQWLLRPDRPADHLLPFDRFEHALGLASRFGRLVVYRYLLQVGPAVSYFY